MKCHLIHAWNKILQHTKLFSNKNSTKLASECQTTLENWLDTENIMPGDSVLVVGDGQFV